MPRHRILLVDDDDDLRVMLAHALGDRFEVVEAFDGLDALTRLDKLEPDLAVLDVGLPNMDGFELCAAIRENPAFGQMPVIFLSAHGGKESLKKGYASGADLFLVKPLEPSRLLKNLELTVEQKAPPIRHKRFTPAQIRQMAEAPDDAEVGTEPVRPEPPAPPPKPKPAAAPAPPRAAASAPPPTPAPPDQPPLPRMPAPAPAPPGEHRHAPPTFPAMPHHALPGDDGPRARLMIVDNEEDARELLDMTLRRDFEITSADDGLDAVRKIAQYEPDIVLLDVMMPKMNGYQLLQSLRRSPAFMKTIVVMVTAKCSPRDEEHARKLGADEFIGKPYSPDDLLRRIKALTARPGFHIRPKKLPHKEIVEREYLESKAREERQSLDERKRRYHDLQDIIDDEHRRLREGK